MKIVENKVVMPGMLLSDADAMARNTVEAILARQENLDDIYDWKIEDFTIDKNDMKGYATDAASYGVIEDAFKQSLKFVIDTLGDDLARFEVDEAKTNMFPSFPDRPADDGFLTKNKVQQYIKIRRWNEDV